MSAHELYERQCRYDLLHHKMRIVWLESLKRPNDWQDRLLKQSRMILENPVHGYHSVDLSDADYLAELDAFAGSGTEQ
jgi:hypothetical protein